MNIFDLHAHVLPGVDDGAVDMAKSLEMLQNAVASNVVSLAVTPHCNVPGLFDNYQNDRLLNRFQELKHAAEHIPIRLVLGAEVHATDDLPVLLQQDLLPTINGSRYMLIEFPFRCAEETLDLFLDYVLDAGYIPLVAHPERYHAVCRNPNIVDGWLNKGCHLQVNGSSMAGSFGRTVQKTADWLFRNDLVCCVASDAHNTTRRSNFLIHAYDHLVLCYGKRYADILMWENPNRICNNEDL